MNEIGPKTKRISELVTVVSLLGVANDIHQPSTAFKRRAIADEEASVVDLSEVFLALLESEFNDFHFEASLS
jgi:hypothetical protein